MKITCIKKNDQKLSDSQMNTLVSRLQRAILRKGFISNVTQVNGTSIKIALTGKSFEIDINRLGYNARINSFTISHTKTGFKRTSTPTWTQREQFNHTINDVLDLMKLSANIVSGEYAVRYSDLGRVKQWRFPEVYNSGFGLVVPGVLEVVSIDKAEQAVRSFGMNAPFIMVG